MNRRKSGIAALLAVGVAFSACKPPVPKAYGVYAREGRTLIDLTDEDASDDWSLAPDVSILVFEREIAEPAFSPVRDLTLTRTAYVRAERILELAVDDLTAQALLNRGPGDVPIEEVVALPIRNRSVEERGITISVGNPVAVRYVPVEDRRDMLAVVPEKPLEKGTYQLNRASPAGGRGAHFAVGLSADPKQRQEATCMEEYVYTVRRPGGFLGLSQWLTDFGSTGPKKSRREVGGNLVLAVKMEPCSALRESANGARRSAS